MSQEIELAETRPAVLMRTATDVAGLCREIVLKRAIDIKGKKYIKVEEWCTVASLFGAIPSIREVVVEATGIKAICELKTHDGRVLATAEGYVGNDEEMWQKRPLFARRAMAQTRSISRVCRTAYAFVIPMIDAGLSTTPAEEMMGVGLEEPAPRLVNPAPVVQTPVSHPAPPPPPSDEVLAPFGKQKNRPLTEHNQGNLDWLEGVISESVTDPSKSKYRKHDEKLLAAIQAEQARRKPQSQGMQSPPDPLESDIPF